MAFFVEVRVVIARMRAVWLWGDDRGFARSAEAVDNPFVSIERLVCNQSIGPDLRKEHIGAIEIMSLARREMKTRWITERVDGGVDFGAQSAS